VVAAAVDAGCGDEVGEGGEELERGEGEEQVAMREAALPAQNGFHIEEFGRALRISRSLVS